MFQLRFAPFNMTVLFVILNHEQGECTEGSPIMGFPLRRDALIKQHSALFLAKAREGATLQAEVLAEWVVRCYAWKGETGIAGRYAPTRRSYSFRPMSSSMDISKSSASSAH